MNQDDQRAFSEFWERNMDDFIRFGMVCTGGRPDFADIVQNVAELLIKKHWETTLAHADENHRRSYCFRSIKNQAKNLATRRWARETFLPDDHGHHLSSDQGNPLAYYVSSMQADQSMQLLFGLPRRQRQVLWLRSMLGADVADVAQILKISEGTVKSTLSRALVNARARIAEQSRSATVDPAFRFDYLEGTDG